MLSGDSGAPLFNGRKELIGVMSATATFSRFQIVSDCAVPMFWGNGDWIESIIGNIHNAK